MTAILEKKALSAEDLEAQTAFELPDRELMGGKAHVHKGGLLGINLFLLNVIVNNVANDANVDVLSNNDVDVTLVDGDINVFCNQVITLLSAQCIVKEKW